MARAQETALVRAAKAGDPRALRRLLELLSGPIYRFGRGFCRDPHDAEDVMQEVLISLTRNLPRFRGEASLATWAYAVARNACARQRRRGVHEPKRLESLDGAGGDRAAFGVADRGRDPHHALERRELRAALERAIAALPPPQREVLVLRDVEGLSAIEVGRILGLGERAVKSRLHRARMALRESLAPFAPVARGRPAPARASRRPRVEAPGGSCPDTVRLLSRHLEGELDAGVCARLAGHVSACASCSAACAALRGALSACRRWQNAPLPAEIRAAVRRAIRQVVEERASAPG